MWVIVYTETIKKTSGIKLDVQKIVGPFDTYEEAFKFVNERKDYLVMEVTKWNQS